MNSSSKLTDDYERKLLDGWEDVYKKGQLTMWVLLALSENNKHMNQIKDYIETMTNNTLVVDDQSMYRALRRYDNAELVSFTNMPSQSGPDLKVYAITDTGRRVLTKFIERNITGVFLHPSVKSMLISLVNK